jgi:hypothetical protein
MNKLIPPHGGYRELKSFQNAELVYDAMVKSSRTYSTGMENLPSEVRQAYRNLADLPKYQHFVRIPDRIIQCIDYFGIAYDRAPARERLLAYYLFIGVVDDAIDSGRIGVGKLILEYLRTPAPEFANEARHSSVRLITEVLKVYISERAYPVMLDKLRELHDEVISELSAASVDSYIVHRKSVGALTAELSYLLISADLGDDKPKLCDFMKQVGAIGCLIDSLIDLKKDHRLGLLAFHPGIVDYAKLMVAILRNGLRVSLRHPRLYGLFFRAVVDNMRDPFRAEQTPQPTFVPKRKDKAASVA